VFRPPGILCDVIYSGEEAMRNQRGVTLVELLVIVALMGVIIVPIMLLLSVSMNSHQDVMVKNELQHEARLVIEYMVDKMREGYYWNETRTHLIFELGGQEVMFYNGSNEIRQSEATPSLVFTQRVQSFFIQFNQDELVVEVTLVLQEGHESYQLRTMHNY